MGTLFVFDRHTWHNITMWKQTIIAQNIENRTDYYQNVSKESYFGIRQPIGNWFTIKKIIAMKHRMSRVFTNGPGDWGSIASWIIPKTQKWYMMPPCLTLSIKRQRSKVKWSNPGNKVAASPTLWCSNYWKGSLRVTLNYGRQLYFYFQNFTKESNFGIR